MKGEWSTVDKSKELKKQLEQLKTKKENLERNIRLIELKLERITLSAEKGKTSNAKKK
jgi:hypothetical protein